MGRGSSKCWATEAVDLASVPRAAAATSSRDVHFFHTANLPPTPRVFVCSVHAQTSPAVPALIWGGGQMEPETPLCQQREQEGLSCLPIESCQLL